MTTESIEEARARLESNEQLRELLFQVEIGVAARQFLESKLGRALIARAENEREAAISAIDDCDPTDSKMVMKIQAQKWRAESFQYWIADLIAAGDNAETQLKAFDQSN